MTRDVRAHRRSCGIGGTRAGAAAAAISALRVTFVRTQVRSRLLFASA